MKLSKFLITFACTSLAQAAPDKIQAVYEAFSIPKSEATELQRAGHNDQIFYQVLVAATAEKKAKQEKLIALRSTSGQKAASTQCSELIFPTEFEPPELPNQVGIPLNQNSVDKEGKPKTPDVTEVNTGIASIFPSTPATPSAFDTYLAGDQFEIEATLGESGNTIDLRFSYTCDHLIGMDVWGQGLSAIPMPRMSHQNQTASLSVKNGVPILVGTVTPVLEAQDPGESERVWFAFLTTTVIKSSE